jgi:hypothetical protein
MNILRKTATTLGGIFFAVLLIAALAPKATRGIAAALVQVTNTASNAVPTEDGPGNFPFGVIGCADIGNVACETSLPPSVPVTTSTGAAVKRLVIEDLNVACGTNDPARVVTLFELDVPLPADNSVQEGGSVFRYEFPLTAIDDGFGGSNGHFPVRIYADPGTAFSTTRVFGPPGLGVGNTPFCSYYLTGHLETK